MTRRSEHSRSRKDSMRVPLCARCYTTALVIYCAAAQLTVLNVSCLEQLGARPARLSHELPKLHTSTNTAARSIRSPSLLRRKVILDRSEPISSWRRHVRLQREAIKVEAWSLRETGRRLRDLNLGQLAQCRNMSNCYNGLQRTEISSTTPRC